MARWVKTYRRDVARQIIKAIELLTKKGRSPFEIIFAIVKRFHPSKMEFAHALSQIQIEANGEPNYYAMKYGNQAIRLFNKRHLLNQEIISVTKIDIAANGREIRRALLDIAYGDNAGKAADQMAPVIEGSIEKEKRLRDKQHNGRRVKRAADKLEERIFS